MKPENFQQLQTAHLESLVLIEKMRNRLCEMEGRAPLYSLEEHKIPVDLGLENISLQIERLELELRRSEERVTNLRQQLAVKAEQVEELYASNSWRITAPVRAVSRLVKLARNKEA